LSAHYRVELGRPLALEESLLRHPKMRLYVMHAGWPLIDEMLALLFYHPLGKRVMFGSDDQKKPGGR